MAPAPEQLTDHWWWRPGWRPGRRMYTCHLTFGEHPAVHALAETYRRALAASGAPLALVPDTGLHLTMQGLAFTDEIADETVDAVARAASARLARIPAPLLTLGPAVVTPEAVLLDVAPAGPVRAIRTAIRDGIADVLGPGQVPEPEAGFRPHVSVAYATGTAPIPPLARRLDALAVEPVTVTVTHADLIRLGRDEQLYEWTTHTRCPLAPTA
ncbi:2'-5' RNA ligase family protein [Streptomyces sp. NPDC001054]